MHAFISFIQNHHSPWLQQTNLASSQ